MEKDGSQGYICTGAPQNTDSGALPASPAHFGIMGMGGSDLSHKIKDERPAPGVPSSKGIFWNLLSARSHRGPGPRRRV